MSDDKKPPAKEAAKPSFVPRESIFEYRTGQKGANGGIRPIGDVPGELEQIGSIARDLSALLKKLNR